MLILTAPKDTPASPLLKLHKKSLYTAQKNRWQKNSFLCHLSNINIPLNNTVLDMEY